MNFLKKLIPASYVFLASLAVEFVLIWWLYPGPSDLKPVKAFTGVYSYDGGNARSRTFTAVDRGVERQPLFCSISFIGPQDSCHKIYLDKKIVTVQIARYHYLFGEGEVLVQLTTSDGVLQISNSRELLIAQWFSSSILSAILYALVAATIFYVIHKSWFVMEGKKNGN